MTPDAGFDLCLIVDGSPAHARAVQQVLAVAKGRIAVQLRMKGAACADIRGAALSLQRITRDTDVPLYLNTHAILAAELGFEGVQLPAAEVAARLQKPPQGRMPTGASPRMGASCHDGEEIARATQLGADFVVLSPFAAVPGKGPALGAQAFAALARASVLPVVALGGLHPGNAADAIRAGAVALGCIRGVLDAADPARAAARLLDAMQAAR